MAFENSYGERALLNADQRRKAEAKFRRGEGGEVWRVKEKVEEGKVGGVRQRRVTC